MTTTNPNAGINNKTLPFITSAWGMVEATLAEKGQINMMAVLVNRQNAAIMFVPPGGLKDTEEYAQVLRLVTHAQNAEIPPGFPMIMQMMLKDMIKSMGDELIYPDLVVHISEAWMISIDLDKPNTLTAKALARMQREGLHNHPDRIEAVLVGWKTKDGEGGHQSRRLLRDENGKPSLGDYIINEKVGKMGSRFLDDIFVVPDVPTAKKH